MGDRIAIDEYKLDELQKLIEDASKKIEEIKNGKNGKNGKKDCLYLEVNTFNSLNISYNGARIGFILEDGRCFILNDSSTVTRYEEWRAAGMKINTDRVEWRGEIYYLSGTYLRSAGPGGNIYDFRDCAYVSNCKDDNIVRFKHNDMPIGF